MYYKIPTAFTIVELMIGITIISILSTIWMIFYSWHITNSKDVIRVTDVWNIRQLLEITYIKSGDLPIPDDGVDINYKANVVWTQGVFGTGSRISVRNLDAVPQDPGTDNYYSYSLLKNKKEYEVVTIFEWDLISSGPNIITPTYAAEKKAYTVWNYNKKFSVVKNGTNSAILALPSITSSDTSDTDIENIVSAHNIVIHSEFNLPASYNIHGDPQSWGVEDVVSDMVIYEWSFDDLSDIVAKKELVRKLQESYNDSIVMKQSSESYESLMKVDSDNSQAVENYIERLSEKSTWWIPRIK